MYEIERYESSKVNIRLSIVVKDSILPIYEEVYCNYLKLIVNKLYPDLITGPRDYKLL